MTTSTGAAKTLATRAAKARRLHWYYLTFTKRDEVTVYRAECACGHVTAYMSAADADRAQEEHRIAATRKGA